MLAQTSPFLSPALNQTKITKSSKNIEEVKRGKTKSIYELKDLSPSRIHIKVSLLDKTILILPVASMQASARGHLPNGTASQNFHFCFP